MNEKEAFDQGYELLKNLDDDTRKRVWLALANLLVIDATIGRLSESDNLTLNDKKGMLTSTGDFSSTVPETFAQFFADVDPQNDREKALVAGYWLQVVSNNETFSGFQVNKELKNLNHRLSNVTYALGQLIQLKPPLALQVKKGKGGKKDYALSQAGINYVGEMFQLSKTRDEC